MDNPYLKKNIHHPLWLLITLTLPQVLLLVFFLRVFLVLRHLLSEEQITLWYIYIGSLLSLCFVFTIYNYVHWWLKKYHFKLTAFLILFSYVVYFYLAYHNYSKLFPRTNFDWIVSEAELLRYSGTFILPCLMYAVFLAVHSFTNLQSKPKAWVNFLLTISIPFFWYLFFNLIIKPYNILLNKPILVHSLIVLLIVSTICFYFFILRTLLIMMNNHGKQIFHKYEFFWKLGFTLIFPVLGLCLNEGYLFDSSMTSISHSIFGNFSHPAFFIIAVFTGIFLIVPNIEHFGIRLFVFLGRILCFSYTMYFFITFLPYYPLVVVLIPVFGTGILVLTPFILLLLHIYSLHQDYHYLKNKLSITKLGILSVIVLLIIPVVMISHFYLEKINLYQALDYAYYKKEFGKQSLKVNHWLLNNTLESISELNWENNQTPFLSSLYQSLVLNHLTLSNQKIHYLRKLYFGENSYDYRENFTFMNNQNNLIESQINNNTEYHQQEKLYYSQLDFILKNNGGNNGEYVVYFELPEGAWINDYYLDVFGEKKQGMLMEKKSVLWIYQQIKRRRQDPGIVYHVKGQWYCLKVFPFAEDEVRYTGMQIVHCQPFQIQLDNQKLNLSPTEPGIPPSIIESNDKKVIWLSPQYKKQLPLTKRIPQYHFILDCSLYGKDNIDQYAEQIISFTKMHPLESQEIWINLVNYQCQAHSFNINNHNFKEELEKKLNSLDFRGGFALDRAIRSTILEENYQQSSYYPLFIILSDSIKKACYNESISELPFIEQPYFYQFDLEEQITQYQIDNFPHNTGIQVKNIPDEKVRFYQTQNKKYYLGDDDSPSLLILDSDFIKDKNPKNTREGLLKFSTLNHYYSRYSGSDRLW
ncbi:MAG: MSEP-CTERM sorting domain-containing protein, partial [Spirochaetes bacterium]|nr:MSEP-CTERM sorting domain-containing protein [Spirochaetota bacterium]